MPGTFERSRAGRLSDDERAPDDLITLPSPPWRLPHGVEHDPLVPTIFHEPWWLDTVAPGQWSAVESVQGDGRTVGRMPYLHARRWGFHVITMPPITHFLGPAITPGQGSQNTRFQRHLRITRDLIRQLPPGAASTKIKMHRGVTDVIGFQMEGFRSSTQFTLEMEPAPIDQLWHHMRDKTRNVARGAHKEYRVDEEMDGTEFTQLYSTNLSDRGRNSLIDWDVVSRAIRICRMRGCGQVLAARDERGIAKAAIFCVWDHAVCYYLLSTRALDSGNGAVTLILWSAMKRAAAGGLMFDFDGLGDVGSILFYSGFGAAIKPRFLVSRSFHSISLLREARNLFIDRHSWDLDVFRSKQGR